MTSSTARPVSPAQLGGVVLGNALEFYDFLVFSFFAVQIGACFFPAADPVASLLAALATFGAGFLTRPLGAVVLGRWSDRVGRRPALILSFALIGGSSLAVALIPSFAAIGWAAPVGVVVCRLMQGFALGGEVGASTAFLAEVATPARRGLVVSFQFVGQYFAIVVAGAIGVMLAQALDDAALAAWGWRIAMAIGALIVPIGLLLRGTLPETLEPRVEVATTQPIRRVAVFGFLVMLSGTITTYVLNYMTTYAKTVLHLSSGSAFGATVVTGIAGITGAVGGGVLSDRVGRRPVMLWATVAGSILILPGFWLITRFPGVASLYTAGTLLRVTLSAGAATALTSVAEALPAHARAGALALVYALAISIFGGSAQFVVAWLIATTGDPLAPAWYMLAAALVGVAAMARADESAPLHR